MKINQTELEHIQKFAQGLMGDVNDEKLMGAATTILHLLQHVEESKVELDSVKRNDAKRRKVMEIILDMDFPYNPEVPIFLREALKD